MEKTLRHVRRNKRTLVTLFISFLAMTCIFLFHQAQVFHSEDVADFQLRWRERIERLHRKTTTTEGMMSLDDIGKKFKEIGDIVKKVTEIFTKTIPNFFKGFSERLLSLQMSTQNFKKGLDNKEKVLQVGAETAHGFFTRYVTCFFEKERGCKTIIVVENVIAYIFSPIVYIYDLIMLKANIQLRYQPMHIIRYLFQKIADLVKPHCAPLRESIDWYNQCYECGAPSHGKLSYNMDTLIPLLNMNANTYLNRTKCQIDFAIRPLEI